MPAPQTVAPASCRQSRGRLALAERAGCAPDNRRDGGATKTCACDDRVVQYSTFTRNKPLAGAVAPATDRSRDVENAPDVCGLQCALSDEDERAQQVADHVVQEAAATHRVDQFLCLSFESGRKNRPHVRDFGVLAPAFRIHSCERREIVFALYERCRLRDLGLIERIRKVPHVSRQEGRADRIAIDPITVGLGARRLAGMKSFVHFSHVKNSDGGWQNVVKSLRKILRGHGARSRKRCHLRKGMHSGIGSSRSLRQDIFSR